jgi:hypothetical protein
MWLTDQTEHTADSWSCVSVCIDTFLSTKLRRCTSSCMCNVQQCVSSKRLAFFAAKHLCPNRTLDSSSTKSFYGLPTISQSVSQSVSFCVQSQSAFMTRHVSWLFVRRLPGRVQLLCWLRNGLNTLKTKSKYFLSNSSRILSSIALRKVPRLRTSALVRATRGWR